MEKETKTQKIYQENSLKKEEYDYIHAVLFSTNEEKKDLWISPALGGIFRFSDSIREQFLSIVSVDGKWFVACEKKAYFRDLPLEQSIKTPVVDANLLTISNDGKIYYLFTEMISKHQMIYRNYEIIQNTELRIGSFSDSDIYYDSPYISGIHASIRCVGRRQILQCYDQKYGIYVNGIASMQSELKAGDVVSIMGLSFVVGPNIISVRDIPGTIIVNLEVSQKYGVSPEDPLRPSKSTRFFNRLPRKKIELPEQNIYVEGPPMSMDQKQLPLVLRMGSSMVMGGTAALAGNFTSLISSVMFPVLNAKLTDKQKQEYEQLRKEKYMEYLDTKDEEIRRACRREKKFLNLKYPDIQEVVMVADKRIHLWERRPQDSDFLQLRLGTGTRALSASIEYPPRRFTLQTDALEEKMYSLVERPYDLHEVPIVLPLADTQVCGLRGQRDYVIELICQMVMQIAVFHSYDEVKVVLFLKAEELEMLPDFSYLPHIWDNQRTIRFVATNEAAASKIGEYLKDHIEGEKSKETELQKVIKNRPYYVIFALDKKLFENHEAVKSILQSDDICGVSIITAYDELPKEAQKVITLEAEEEGICTTMTADGGEDVKFQMDYCDAKEYLKATRVLSNIRLKADERIMELPKTLTFLEMFQVGRVEQLNSLKRWKENNPIQSLAVPVGVGVDGSLLTLDLHEKGQGPHGLVAGMTGSGKSEFILTYILSLAINYHPDEVAFVLIDYKGGGLAGAFENLQTGIRLPHLVGTITNLDGSSIQRSLTSLESELIRRQKIFSETKNMVNEGTMDIYTYQKLYRNHLVTEPVPHLFIISDEFAELKQQQPEFMSKLVSAARIGRSLGVHLILATQKPSGVVDDQIRSNTKFRVCLRVQERSDSMDMLKRPDAAELTDTGRFYLQVGYNEYFALGQSAWCGADYEPQETAVVQTDDAIEILDATGQTIAKAKREVRRQTSGKKQIVAIVEYLSELAHTNGIQTRQLWEQELPKKLDLNELQVNAAEEKTTTVFLGKVDDPERQTQFHLKLDMETCGSIMVVGEAGSGKTTMLQNILYQLVQRLSPQELSLYILDYSSRMMKLLKPLPHCGAVLQEEDSDMLDEFFKLINSLVAQRKRLFSELEVDSFEAARKLKPLPLVLVVIDNYAGMLNSKNGEKHSYQLQSYLKNSANYGIKYIISCSHLNEISSRVRQELETRLCLHMKDRYDYGDALGCKVTYLPPDHPGRGLVNVDGRPLEFQNAMMGAHKEEKERTQQIKQMIDMLRNQYGNQTEAQRLTVLSETATYEDFARQFKRGRIPLGIAKQSGKAVALPLKQFSALSLYFGNPTGARPITENFLWAADREKMEFWVVQRKEKSLFNRNEDNEPGIMLPEQSKVFSLDATSISELQSLFLSRIEEQKILMQRYCEEHEIVGKPEIIYKKTFDYVTSNSKPILLLIESFSDFCNSLNMISGLIFDKCFKMAQHSHVYVIGCFAQNDFKQLQSRTVYYGFNPDANIMLFGGHFEKQDICVFAENIDSDITLPYNSCVMNYQGRFYPIVMPCGDIKIEEEDADELSIF